MNLKDKIIAKLSSQTDTFFSGEALAQEYDVSRAAVWKAIRVLQKEGHQIESSSRGYRYLPSNDLLNREIILSLCPDISYPLIVFDTIDSTNTYAKTIASNKDAHGTLVVANHQTAGRGRRGHSFYSPENTGLYLTLIIKPERRVQEMLKVTVAAAVASVEAIEETSEAHPQIKWVNDLFIGKRKIAGILTEAIADFETGDLDAIIIGIGINIRDTELPDDIVNIAGAINDPSLTRNQLAAALWRRLLYWTDHLESKELMDAYRRYSLLIGHTIAYEINGVKKTGNVTSINDEGNLVVNEEDGKETILSSGEVSVKDWNIKGI
ncbi:MAG: biotin--[acetyl-CoA-carboxylase] ligase [Solobacterium sp.]|nr:biotin--[acetyl-CoA-carboxylase] ligase [Solobacterium sp.]